MSSELKHYITHLKIEALALAALMITLTYVSSVTLWVLPVSFLLFDIGMIGYVFGKRIGAFTYNMMHNLTIPTLCIIAGVLLERENVAVFGYCWTFHIATDRILGFGLKHKHSFQETHLGTIGKRTAR